MERGTSKRYIRQARFTLQNSFPLISCAAIDAALSTSECDFTAAFRLLSGVDSRRGTVEGGGAGHFDAFPGHIAVFIKNRRKKRSVRILDNRLSAEIAEIPELNVKEKAVVIDLTASDDEEEDAGAGGDAPEPEEECLCCYVDYPSSEMRECQPGTGHRVCKRCINNYVSEQLDGNDSVAFECIVCADCPNKYSSHMLDEEGLLSPRLKGRVDDRVFREMVKQAGFDNEWVCPKCAYIGFIEGNFASIICPQCNVQYCTMCNEVFHANRTCDDVRREKERLDDPKHRAHEVMSQACKRFCPHCSQEYVKSDGCNKIRCKCGKLSCYLCGEKITDYSHFCNHALAPGVESCPCGKKCRLWTSIGDMERLDRDRRQEAGRKFLMEAGITDEKKILCILASPDKKVPPVEAAVPGPLMDARDDPVLQLQPGNRLEADLREAAARRRRLADFREVARQHMPPGILPAALQHPRQGDRPIGHDGDARRPLAGFHPQGAAGQIARAANPFGMDALQGAIDQMNEPRLRVIAPAAPRRRVVEAAGPGPLMAARDGPALQLQPINRLEADLLDAAAARRRRLADAVERWLARQRVPPDVPPAALQPRQGDRPIDQDGDARRPLAGVHGQGAAEQIARAANPFGMDALQGAINQMNEPRPRDIVPAALQNPQPGNRPINQDGQARRPPTEARENMGARALLVAMEHLRNLRRNRNGGI